MDITRRRLLLNSLFGAGLLGLRSLATGIPMSILANPRKALAGGTPGSAQNTNAQYIILSSSENGDPWNGNVPGTYNDPNIAHPPSATMAPTTLTQSGNSYVAALPWSTLPQAVLDRMLFFHTATYTVVHPDEPNVLALNGQIPSNEMYASLLASQLGPALGTVQVQPIVLGPRNIGEDLIYQGQPQPIFTPSTLSALLSPPTGVIGQLQQLRDNDLNRLNAWVKSEGNGAQAAFIDQYVNSQVEARNLSESLLSTLAGITDNSPNSQVTAAVTLIRMNAAPVISINIPFGGDNHVDANLAGEATQQVAGVGTISRMWQELFNAGIQDRVTFMTLNVFGRTLSASSGAGTGRQHNQNHQVSVVMGSPFHGGPVGGVAPMSGDYGATSISSVTGLPVANNAGDVPFAQTLSAFGLTVGTGVGVDSGFLSENITGGKVIQAALA